MTKQHPDFHHQEISALWQNYISAGPLQFWGFLTRNEVLSPHLHDPVPNGLILVLQEVDIGSSFSSCRIFSLLSAHHSFSNWLPRGKQMSKKQQKATKTVKLFKFNTWSPPSSRAVKPSSVGAQSLQEAIDFFRAFSTGAAWRPARVKM